MKTPALILKRNDTYPYFEFTVKDSDGTGIDLTGATIYASMQLEGATAKKIDRQTAGITIDADQSTNTGQARYEWQAGDTNTASSIADANATKDEDKYNPYIIEFEVTLASGVKFTVSSRDDDPWRVIITEDIDET